MEEGVGIPAGDAIEVGTMKSSRFIGSLGVSAETSRDCLNRVMPPGGRVRPADCADAVGSFGEVARPACFALKSLVYLGVLRDNIRSLHLLSSAKVHCHHSPSQILHSLLVREACLCSAIKFPYLSS